MPINFIPNDPLAGAGGPSIRQQNPRQDRPNNRGSFRLFDAESEAPAQPGTPQFLFWQCREGALASLEAWEGVAGPFVRWQGQRRRIPLIQNAVAQLGANPTINAFYNRASFQFFEFTQDATTTFSGESTDVVAHEVGHGLLDAVRPDLFDTPFLEVGAFHEAFGDCVALLTALADVPSLQAVAGVAGTRNFLETTAEDLSDAIRRFQPNHNAAEPRHAMNDLVWQLPSTLPDDGGPGVVINEEHSFARIFSGCFYDLIRNLAGANPSANALQTAAQTAGKLLAAGAGSAPETERFFQAVGRSMVMADQQANGGANREAVRQAFDRHGVSLGTNAMLAPVAALAGAGPRVSAKAAALPPASRRDLAARLRLRAGTKLALHALEIGGQRVARAVVQKDISLGKLSSRLKGVVVKVNEGVLIGSSGGRAAVLGAFPEATATADEVMAFVGSLVRHERIQYEPTKKTGRGKIEAATRHTHEVVTVRSGKELRRRAFACHFLER